MKYFSKALISELNYYVYQLRDPRNNQVFYIGRGRRNRVFQHGKIYNKKSEKDKEKSKRIKFIKDSGKQLIEEIVAYGLSEKESRIIESTLIKSYTLPALTNEVHGYQGNVPISVKEIVTSISKPIEKFPFNVLFLKINKLWKNSSTEKELKEAIRGYWRLNKEKFAKVRYIIGVTDGISRIIVKAKDSKLFQAGIKANYPKAPRKNEFYSKKYKKKYYFLIEPVEEKMIKRYLNRNFINFVGNFRSSKRYYFGKSSVSSYSIESFPLLNRIDEIGD
jgi:hypothetical protein